MTPRDLMLRARALLRRAQVDRDLDDELAFHIDREAEKLVAQRVGAAAMPAVRAARVNPSTTLRKD